MKKTPLLLTTLMFFLSGCATTPMPAPVEDRQTNTKRSSVVERPDASQVSADRAKLQSATVRVHTVEDRAISVEPLTPQPLETETSIPDTDSGTVESAVSSTSSVKKHQLVSLDDDVNIKASGAVVALLETSRRHADAGRDQQAVADIERGLRIEPQNPWLWHRLALLRLQQGQWQQAREFALKSNGFAKDDLRVRQGNQIVIDEACTRAPSSSCQ